MRLSLALLGLAAAIVTFVLFRVSYDVQGLEERLSGLNRRIVQEQESIRVLRAEWTYLNRPTRLQELARLTQLQAVRAEQLITSARELSRPLQADPIGAMIADAAGMSAVPAEPPAPPLLASLLRVPGLEQLPLPARKPGAAIVDTAEAPPAASPLRRRGTFLLAAETAEAVAAAVPLMADFRPGEAGPAPAEDAR